MIQTSKKTEKEVANDKSAKIMNGVATWCSFYRANPHRFAKDYLGISLKLFQVILLYMMNVSNYFMYLAARGQGKTWLTALYCCFRAICYPNSKIVVCSSTRKQGNEVLLKIQDDFMKNYPLIATEVERCNIGQNEAAIYFKNHSWIRVVTASDSGRGMLVPFITNAINVVINYQRAKSVNPKLCY